MILTERLRMVPATLESCAAEVEGAEAVGRALQARMPDAWPPPVFEAEDVERIRQALATDSAAAGWLVYYLVLTPAGTASEAQVVGVAGYAGAPTADGLVEVGYAVAAEHQRRGYATEATRALVARAFADTRVSAVRAQTYRPLKPSIRVLEKIGFSLLGIDAETGLVRYELRRR